MNSTETKDGFYVKLQPTVKQYMAYKYLSDLETLVLVFGGGAGGGKSWLGCEWIMSQAVRFPETRYFIGREKLTVLKQTTLITFFKVCKYHGLKKNIHYKYNSQAGTITFFNDSVIQLLEVKMNPSDPMYEDLGSLEVTQGFLDEGGEIPFGAVDTLKSRVGRHMNDKYNIPPKILITANPKKNFMYTLFYKPFVNGFQKPESKFKFLQALVDDNHYIESSYKANLQALTDATKKRRLLYGDWEYEDDPASLMKYDNIIDMFYNPVIADPLDPYVTADIARLGKDKTVFKLWHGLVEVKKLVLRKKNTTESSRALIDFLTEHNVPRSRCVVDEDGIGGGVVDQVQGVKGFIARSTPFLNKATGKPDNYASLKDQCGYKLAEYINDHKIRVMDNDDTQYHEDLVQELEQIKQKHVDNDSAKKSLVPKDIIKDLIGRSPDYSDTLIMRMFFEFDDIDAQVDDEWGDEETTWEEDGVA
jgi:hypothetical protein